jgi:aldehyde:ferredoxin oxidoreductase
MYSFVTKETRRNVLSLGYKQRILRAILSTERLVIEKPETSFYRCYFGGSGFIGYYLLKELKPGVDPLGPENKLIFATGIVTGAPISGSGRNIVGAKSPLTGTYGEASAGGFFGPELKRAGFDAIIVEGVAKRPVYLWVHDGEAEIRDATHLWGLDIGDAQEEIHKELGDKHVRTAMIGRGGENMVEFACIINDLKHVAGRCGLGAVMGSKKLKAIATRGHNGLEVADIEKLREMNKWLFDHFSEVTDNSLNSPLTLHEYGTGVELDGFIDTGRLPVRNFRDWARADEFRNQRSISAKALKDSIGYRLSGCYGCAVACKKEVRINEPGVVDPVYGGPEYESLAALGSNCGVDDLKAICKANELCNRYSLDTISTGCTVAFAMECFENGLLTEEDTNGLQLNFGNAEAMLQIIEMIANRQGIGDLLAEGSRLAAKRIKRGAERFSMEVKGQGLPMHDPRLQPALSLGFAVSPTGAEHVINMYDSWVPWERMKAFGILDKVPIKDLGPKKVRVFIYYVYWRTIANCLPLCIYTPWDYTQIVEILRAVTGWNTTAWEWMKVAERARNLAQSFNVREGFTEKDDWLPDRFFHPKTSDGASLDAIDPHKLQKAKHMYYRIMGWDERTGVPMLGKLEELGIPWVYEKLTEKIPKQ